MGSIILYYRGHEAILDKQGVWSSEDTKLETYLNGFFNSEMYPPSVSVGSNVFASQAREAVNAIGPDADWEVLEEELDEESDEVVVY